MPSLDLNEPPTPKKIELDFSETRRTSFLPDNFSEVFGKEQTSFKSVKILECNEDDDLFMYVGGFHGQIESKPLQNFCTGSKYLGTWNKLGVTGKGIYKYPHGVMYDGYFNRKGQFHGTGVLVYPNGQKVEGIWKNGKLGSDLNFITKGGAVATKNYCLMPDRRYQIELENDLNPPGQEYLTDESPPARTIPEDCYDVVDGYYDPKVKTVYEYPKDQANQATCHVTKKTESQEEEEEEEEDSMLDSFTKLSEKTEIEKNLSELITEKGHNQDMKIISWIPSTTQEDWIMKNCRKAWDENTGYRPDLYEEWTKGVTSTTYKLPNEHSTEYVSYLEKLNLSNRISDGYKRLPSFIKKVDRQDSVLMLAKMFLKQIEGTEAAPKYDY